ncbi:MAG: FixH family protein [Nitrospiraceae bacterium]
MRYISILLISMLAITLWGCSPKTSLTNTVDSYQVSLQLANQPVKAGEQEFSVRVTPTTEDLRVSVKTTMPDMPEMKMPDPVLEKTKDGYTGKADFAMAGDWQVVVSLQSGNQPEVFTTFDVKVVE